MSCWAFFLLYNKVPNIRQKIIKHLKAAEDLNGLVSQYNTVLTDLMDKYAPAKQKTIILRPNTGWHTDRIDVAIAGRRKAEGVWRSSILTVQIYREKCTTVTNIIRQAKCDFYSRKFSDAGSDQEALFTLSQTTMSKNRDISLPTIINKDEIADKFAEFFTDKVAKIRSDLDL